MKNELKTVKLLGLDTVLTGNENRLLAALPVFEDNGKCFVALTDTWHLDKTTSYREINRNEWPGILLDTSSTYKINYGESVLFLGADYFLKMRKSRFYGQKQPILIKEAKPATGFYFITKPFSNINSSVRRLFHELLAYLDEAFVSRPGEIHETLSLLESSVGLTENGYKEFSIRKIYYENIFLQKDLYKDKDYISIKKEFNGYWEKIDEMNDKKQYAKISSLEELAEDLLLDSTFIEKEFNGYCEKIDEMNDKKQYAAIPASLVADIDRSVSEYCDASALAA